jgi:hypothetical protein
MSKLFSALVSRVSPLRRARACDPFAHCEFFHPCGEPTFMLGCCFSDCWCC